MAGKKKKSPGGSPKKSPKRSPKKSPKGSPKRGKKGASHSPKKKGKKGKSKAAKELPPEAQEEVVEKKPVPEPPPGVMPLFLTTQTQEIFKLVPEVNVSKEEPNTMLDKNAIIEDMNLRKAISDFSPIKEMIEAYPTDEVLVVWDSEFLYGENYFVCVTEEAKGNILYPTDEEEEEEEDPFALPDIPYVHPESKPWVVLGSDVEVTNEQVYEVRPKLKMSITKPRRHFGEKFLFSNRDADAAKDSYQECLPNPDKRQVVCQKELDKGVQAVPLAKVRDIQTDYLKPLKQWSQYEARQFSEEDKTDLLDSERIQKFVKEVTPAMESALQQNEIINLFSNDWMKLNPGGSLMTQRRETYLKEYQSFQDLHYSKDKQIICDDWHVTIPGVVGVSCVQQMSFDVRLRNMSRISLMPSLVLLWNYQDPIHPRLLLETPDDCFIFRFNPVNPNLVAGGCMSGRIVLWDLTEYYGKLSLTESTTQIKKLEFLSNLVEDTEGKIPIVQPVATSNIDFGHSMCVTDIQWLQPPYIIDKQGKILEEGPVEEECHQFISCAGDDHFFIWDITVQDRRRDHAGAASDAAKFGPWHLLATNWRPVVRLYLPMRPDGTQYSLCQFRMWYKAREVKVDDDEEENGEDGDPNEKVPEKPPPEGGDELAKSPLSIYAGTQAGEILFLDFRVKVDSDTKKTMFYDMEMEQVHAAPIRTICISNFFDDMVLTVGGFRFAVWKVSVKRTPLMVSAEAPARRTSGAWSLTRASVFFIGRQDGMIEVWDILDRAQEPMLTQSLSGVEVTSLNLRKLGRRQVLSVSDNSGNLHLLEVPPLVTQVDGDELDMLENLFKRETFREEEEQRKMEEMKPDDEEDEEKPAAGQAPAPPPAPAPAPDAHEAGGAEDAQQGGQKEWEAKELYEAYEKMEKQVLDKLLGREPPEDEAPESAAKDE